jgi:hypothetical protein
MVTLTITNDIIQILSRTNFKIYKVPRSPTILHFNSFLLGLVLEADPNPE